MELPAVLVAAFVQLFHCLGMAMQSNNGKLRRRWIITGLILLPLLIAAAVIAPTVSLGVRLMRYNTSQKCQEAIASGVTDPLVYENLSAFQSAAHRDDQAIQTLRQGVKYNPDNHLLAYSLSGILAENGQGQEALGIDKRLAKFDDEWGRAARRHLRHNHIPGY